MTITQAIYNYRLAFTLKLYLNFINLNIKYIVIIAAAIRFCTWFLKINFRFNYISSHFINFNNCKIVLFNNVIMAINSFLDLSKCINSNLELSNWITFWFAYLNTILINFCSISIFLTIVFDCIYRAILLIKLDIWTPNLGIVIRILRNKNRIYIKNNIGEIDDSCDILVITWCIYYFCLSKANKITLYNIKYFIYSIIWLGNFNLIIIYIN